MIKALSPLKTLNTYLKCQEIRTDNFVFRLHCVLTTVILLTWSIILTSTQVIGKPIECFGADEKIQKPVTTFCWTMTTYTLPEDSNKKVGSEVAYPGVGNESGKQTKHYIYYQWACFVLFFQALMCYMPKWILDICEGGLIAKLATGMNAMCPDQERMKKEKAILDYLESYKGEHKSYALVCWVCELLCLVNLLLQMWLMNTFLDGQFWSYGTTVLQQSNLPQNERSDPMINIFPRMTKCTFFKYGPSGSIQNIDNLCVLPQNIVNEKIFIFLWFWYIILAVMLALLVTLRMLMLFVPSVRARLLQFRSYNLVPAETASLVTRSTGFGDWWLLYRLSQNMDIFIYRDLITQLAQRISGKGTRPDKRNSAYAYTYIPCPHSPKV